MIEPDWTHFSTSLAICRVSPSIAISLSLSLHVWIAMSSLSSLPLSHSLSLSLSLCLSLSLAKSDQCAHAESTSSSLPTPHPHTAPIPMALGRSSYLLVRLLHPARWAWLRGSNSRTETIHKKTHSNGRNYREHPFTLCTVCSHLKNGNKK